MYNQHHSTITTTTETAYEEPEEPFYQDSENNFTLYQLLNRGGIKPHRPGARPDEKPSWQEVKRALRKTERGWRSDEDRRREIIRQRAVARQDEFDDSYAYNSGFDRNQEYYEQREVTGSHRYDAPLKSALKKDSKYSMNRHSQSGQTVNKKPVANSWISKIFGRKQNQDTSAEERDFLPDINAPHADYQVHQRSKFISRERAEAQARLGITGSPHQSRTTRVRQVTEEPSTHSKPSPRPRKRLTGLAKVYGSERAIPVYLQNQYRESFQPRDYEPDEFYYHESGFNNNNGGIGDNKASQENPSFGDEHVEFIVGPGYQHPSVKKQSNKPKDKQRTDHRGEGSTVVKEYILHRDNDGGEYFEEYSPPADETITRTEYRTEISGEEVNQGQRYSPGPQSANFRGRRLVNKPEPRLAHSTKKQDKEKVTVDIHQGASINKETIERLSQPRYQLIQEPLVEPQALKKTWKSKSLSDLRQIEQPRLAYSRLENYDDLKLAEQEYYDRKNQEKRPINQEAVDRLSQPSKRYLDYRRLEDQYRHQLEETIKNRPKPKRRRRLFSQGDIPNQGVAYPRDKTLDEWEHYYQNSKKSGKSKEISDPIDKLSKANQKHFNWQWKQKYYLNKINQAQKKQAQEKQKRKSLNKFKDLSGIRSKSEERGRARARNRSTSQRSRSLSNSLDRERQGRVDHPKPWNSPVKKSGITNRGRSRTRKAPLQEKRCNSGSRSSKERDQERGPRRNKDHSHLKFRSQSLKESSPRTRSLSRDTPRSRSLSKSTPTSRSQSRNTARSRSQSRNTPENRSLSRNTPRSRSHSRNSISPRRSEDKKADEVPKENQIERKRENHSKKQGKTKSILQKSRSRSNSRSRSKSPHPVNQPTSSSQVPQLPPVSIKKPKTIVKSGKSKGKKHPGKRIRFATPEGKKMANTFVYEGQYDDDFEGFPEIRRSYHETRTIERPRAGKYSNVRSRLLDHFSTTTRSDDYDYRAQYNGERPKNVYKIKKRKPVTTYRKIRHTPPGSGTRRVVHYSPPSVGTKHVNSKYDVYYDNRTAGTGYFKSHGRSPGSDGEYDVDYGRRSCTPNPRYDLIDPEFRDINYSRDAFRASVGSRKYDGARPSLKKPKKSVSRKTTYLSGRQSPSRLRDVKTVVQTSSPYDPQVIHERHTYHHRENPEELLFQSPRVTESRAYHDHASPRGSLPPIYASHQDVNSSRVYSSEEYNDVRGRPYDGYTQEISTREYQYNNNNHLDNESVADSITTIQPSDSVSERQYRVNERSGWESTTTRDIIHEGDEATSSRMPDYSESVAQLSVDTFDGSDDTLNLDLPARHTEVSQKMAFHTDHRKWPMYRFEQNGGLACLVRAAPSQIGDVKQGLRLVDRIPKELSQRLPSLPFMDFDSDEAVSISPMQLVWDHPHKKLPNMEEPIYLMLPLNPDMYNDVLQQVFFLYTSDLEQWRYAQGRVVKLPIEDKEYDFLEVIIHDPFRYIIFDIKARFIEDVHTFPVEGGEMVSSMDPGIRIHVAKRSFDNKTKVKLRVEPLDMNELDLSLLIPSVTAIHACAVSPIIKISASEPTKRPISVFIPKPGYSTYGSQKLGLHCKLQDLRNQKVHLFTKDRQIMRYQLDTALQREFSNEYEFQVKIWKAGGCCYAFLVLEGAQPNIPEEDQGFLNSTNLRQLASEMEPNEKKIRLFGKQLLNQSSVDDIFHQHPDEVPLIALKILRRWRNQFTGAEESAMVRHLVLTLRETGMSKEAVYLQRAYKDHLLAEEGSRLVKIFEEIKSCPTVLVHWKMLARALGIHESEVRQIESQRKDLRKRCSLILKKAFERYREEEQFYRDIVLKYTRALSRIGCPRIAASIERRHLSKFYMNESY